VIVHIVVDLIKHFKEVFSCLPKKNVKIIFDTDIGGDCDDAGALAMLHRLCDLGEAELLAVTACYASPYVAGCIDAINRYYNREVPVGINYSAKNEDGGVYAGSLCKEFPSRYPQETYGIPNAAPDTLHVLRKTLAHADDHSITLDSPRKIDSDKKDLLL